MRKKYAKYLASKAWKEKRLEKLKQSATCECEGGCLAPTEQVHHRHYNSIGSEQMDDLQALCKRCHFAKHKPQMFNSECCTKLGPTPIHRLKPFSAEALALDIPLPPHNGTDADFALGIDLIETQPTDEDLANATIESKDSEGRTLFTVDSNRLPPPRLSRYQRIAKELGTSARIAAILDNLFMMFACGEIQIEEELTEALKPWVNTVNAEEAGLGGYGYEEIYVVKPEFTQHFKHDEEEVPPNDESE